MEPAELRRVNIERFQGLLLTEIGPKQRDIIEGLLAEERLKPDSAYPPGPAPPRRAGAPDFRHAKGRWASPQGDQR